MPKELIVLCDGTGNSPEVNKNNPTNVQVLREILGYGLDPLEPSQYSAKGGEVNIYNLLNNNKRVVYYGRGLGSPKLNKEGEVEGWSWKPKKFFKNGPGVYNRFVLELEKIAAVGLIDNVAQAYEFLVNNYEEGDTISLFGFSRGAYTLRILITLIRYIGLINKKSSKSCPSSNDVRNAIEDGFKVYNSEDPPDANDRAKRFQEAYKCYPSQGLVNFLGLWDTVRGKVKEKVRQDGKLSSTVQVARHALAIDEQRFDFKPELWVPPVNTDSQQVWFPGVHSDIGGGYPNRDLANITLHWMVDEFNEWMRKHGKWHVQISSDSLKGYPCNTNTPFEMHDSLRGGLLRDNGAISWEARGIYRRPICQMVLGETIHKSVLERYQQNFKQRVGVGEIPYQPSNLTHMFVAFKNGAKEFASLQRIKGFKLADPDTLPDWW